MRIVTSFLLTLETGTEDLLSSETFILASLETFVRTHENGRKSSTTKFFDGTHTFRRTRKPGHLKTSSTNSHSDLVLFNRRRVSRTRVRSTWYRRLIEDHAEKAEFARKRAAPSPFVFWLRERRLWNEPKHKMVARELGCQPKQQHST